MLRKTPLEEGNAQSSAWSIPKRSLLYHCQTRSEKECSPTHDQRPGIMMISVVPLSIVVHVNLAKEYQYIQLCIEIPELRVICYPGVAGETPRQDGIIGEELLRVLHKPASKPNKTSTHLQAEVQPVPLQPS